MLSVKWKITWRNINQLCALNSHIRQRENLDNCARTLRWIPQRNPKQGDTCWTATVCLWTPCTDDTRSWKHKHIHIYPWEYTAIFCFDQICWKIILVVNNNKGTNGYLQKYYIFLRVKYCWNYFHEICVLLHKSKRFTYYQPWVSRAKSGILSAMGYTHSEQLPFSTSLRVSCSWYEQKCNVHNQIHSICKYSDKMVIMDITR